MTKCLYLMLFFYFFAPIQMTFEESEMKKAEEEGEEETADQLTQLIHVFTQGALDSQGEQTDDKV